MLLLLLLLLSLLTPLISSPITHQPVYFLDNDIEKFTNVIDQDNQIFALGNKWSKWYFYCFDQNLHLKFKKKISDSGSKISMMPYKKGFLITSSEYRNSDIIHISKKGKVINSLEMKGSIKDCCIYNDQIFLFILRDRQFFFPAKINENFEMLLSESIELKKTGALKLYLSETNNYLVTFDTEASIYTFDKMWNFIDKKTLAECDWSCHYQLDIRDEQVIIYPQNATWITKPQIYTHYAGQPLEDQVQYFDLEGNLLKTVAIPRYRGFSTKLVKEENMYIQQSELLKTLYLVSPIGDILREMNFDFAFSMKDHAILSDEKYLFAGECSQGQYWQKHGLLIFSQSPLDSLSLFPMTDDAFILETAFKTNDNEMLGELMEKWYQSGNKPKKRFWRKWEREAYTLYLDIFPIKFELYSSSYPTIPGTPFYDPIYQLIPSHLTVEISESISIINHPTSSSATGYNWIYEPIKVRHEIKDFRPDLNAILDSKFIYSTDAIARSLSGFLALTEIKNLNHQKKIFLKYYIDLNIGNRLAREPLIYGFYNFPCIIFDRKYQRAIVRTSDGRNILCVKKSRVWQEWHGIEN